MTLSSNGVLAKICLMEGKRMIIYLFGCKYCN